MPPEALLNHVVSAPSYSRLFTAVPNPHSVSVSHRRTAVKSSGLTCRFAGSCKVSKAQRRHCPACRLQRCLDAGMKKDSESASSHPESPQTLSLLVPVLTVCSSYGRHSELLETSHTMSVFCSKPPVAPHLSRARDLPVQLPTAPVRLRPLRFPLAPPTPPPSDPPGTHSPQGICPSGCHSLPRSTLP